MLKYRPAQVAKAIAAVLTAAATMLVTVSAATTDFLPPGWLAALGAASTALIGASVYLTKAAPTIEQVSEHLEDIVELVDEVTRRR